MIGSLAVTLLLVDPTMRGPGTTYLTLPTGMIFFALSAALLHKHRPTIRTGLAALLALAGFGFSILLRAEGMTGDYVLSLRCRWSPTPEASMLAARKPEPTAGTNRPTVGKIELALANPEWPGFRGTDRASRSRGPQISTNWIAHPPRQLWKIPVGPAWSSFAVAGNLLFTQEQRGPMETVVCYEWKFMNYRALQPHCAGDNTFLLPTMSPGTRTIRVTRTNGQLAAEELWTSRNLKPDFTDLVRAEVGRGQT